jgi:hypothetical protein
MRLFKKLWNDEAGMLLSAEAAILGTVAVVGVGAGMNVVATSVNEELKEVGYALRSLDQSYSIPDQKGCNGAWTAGSEYKQQPVEQSIKELKQVERKAEQAAKKQSQRLKERVQNQNKKKAEARERKMKKQEKQN